MTDNPTETVQMVPVPIAALYVNCSFPERADAIAASDTCQRFARSGVVDPETGNTYWRCDQHKGMVRVRPGYTPAVLTGEVIETVLRAPTSTVVPVDFTSKVDADGVEWPDRREPYVGRGAEGCLRSAEIDRSEADGLDPGERRDACLASAERWEAQARTYPSPATGAEVIAEPRARQQDAFVTTIGPVHDGMQAVAYGSQPFPFLSPAEIEEREQPEPVVDHLRNERDHTVLLDLRLVRKAEPIRDGQAYFMLYVGETEVFDGWLKADTPDGAAAHRLFEKWMIHVLDRERPKIGPIG